MGTDAPDYFREPGNVTAGTVRDTSSKDLQLLDQLATERLSKVYASSTVPGRQVTLKWLSGS